MNHYIEIEGKKFEFEVRLTSLNSVNEMIKQLEKIKQAYEQGKAVNVETLRTWNVCEDENGNQL